MLCANPLLELTDHNPKHPNQVKPKAQDKGKEALSDKTSRTLILVLYNLDRTP
jgi:hypothetical protein